MYTLKTFRANLTEAFKRAEEGEVVEVTRLGIPYELRKVGKKGAGGFLVKGDSPVLKPMKEAVAKYGCGCKYKEGHKFCPTHNRY